MRLTISGPNGVISYTSLIERTAPVNKEASSAVSTAQKETPAAKTQSSASVSKAQNNSSVSAARSTSSVAKPKAAKSVAFEDVMKSITEGLEKLKAQKAEKSGSADSSSLDSAFTEASEKYGVDKKLLLSVARQESNFDPYATSKSGAMGIMQLMPYTAEAYGVTNPYDAKESIMGGAACLKDKLDEFDNDIPLALAAYNAGSNAVKKYDGIPPYEETMNYVEKVLENYYDKDLKAP